MLSEICRAIYSPVFGWTAEAGRDLCNRLIELMGGKTTNNDAETSAKVVKNGEKYQLDTYDALGNERHKAVCELRGISVDELCKKYDYIDIYPEFIWSIGQAIGLRHGAGFEEIISRLIRLLGGDNGTASNGDGTCPITVQSPSITDELRKFAETFRYEWYDVKDGSSCYTTSDCPPSLDSVNMTDYINGIADRIEEQFARCCKLWERTATDTAQEVHDSMEAECNELSRDIEMWRDRAEDMRMERDDLQAELRVANQTHECNRKLAKRNGRWCDELLDLIRDAAKDYQECQRLLRVFKCHVKDIRRERDDLLDKLQAISVLCEQDDG